MKLSRAVAVPTSSFLQKLLACALIYALVGAESAVLAVGPLPASGDGGMMAPALSPQALFQEALLFYLKRGMSAALPLELDPTKVLPTVPNGQLPGGPFHGRPLALTAANVSGPLPPGDYEIPVLAYCTQYSVHRAGQGAATTLGPVTGTQAQAISNLLWRGTQAGISPSRLQTAAWAMQAGVRYDHMSKQSQQDINSFAPEGRANIEHGFSIDAPVRQLYNDMVANPRKYILEYKHEKGMNFPDFLIPNIMIAAPSFDQLIAQAGPIGREYVRAELEQQAVQRTLNDREHGEESLLLNQAPTDPPLPPSQGPWTLRVPSVAYIRFIVNGGNMQANNVMQIRVLPKNGSYDDVGERSHKPYLVYAAYQDPISYSLLEMMGGGAIATSPLVKTNGTSSRRYGSPTLEPIIAFPSIPAQALILVVPPFLRPPFTLPPVQPTTANPPKKPAVKWVPGPGETHPTHDEVDDAMKIAGSQTNDCAQISYAIDVLVRDLKFRRWDWQRGGRDPGHLKPYKIRQNALQELLSKAKVFRCNYEPEADSEENRPIDSPTPKY